MNFRTAFDFGEESKQRRSQDEPDLLRKKRQLTNYAERLAQGEWIASTRVEMLFGRNTGGGTTSPLRTENSATMQSSRHELDKIRRPHRPKICRKYQTKFTHITLFHTSS